MSEQAKAKARRARRPIYLSIRRMVDPDTGELVGCLVPSHPIDRRLMRERKFRAGNEVRAELKQPRNPGFHRLAHAVGMLLVDHVAGFEAMDGHSALKRVQAEAGVCCDRERFVIDLGQFGRHEVERNVPRSMAFDEMDEGEFALLFGGVCDWIDEHYSAGLTDDVRGEYLVMTERQREAA